MMKAILAIGIALLAFVAVLFLPVSNPVATSTALTACENAKAGASTESCLAAYNNKLREYRIEYDRWSLNHRARAIQWQFISGILAFFVFNAIVLMGLYLSHLEFTRERETPVTLRIGSTGIDLSSEVIGVVVLVISLLFTTLYVDRIYPIKEIASTSKPRAS